jgi:hypothetical protein
MVRPFTLDEFCHRLLRQGRSNLVFSRLHAAAEVRRWTEVEGAQQEWEAIAPAYGALLRSARHLDAGVRAKLGAGLNVEHCRGLLHSAYWAAFRASKIKGIAERAREFDDTAPVFTRMLSDALATGEPIEARPVFRTEPTFDRAAHCYRGSSVPEVSHPGRDHRDARGIGGRDDLGVANRAAGLDDRRGAGRDDRLHAIREREERVARD